MVKPAVKRRAARHIQVNRPISERHACGLVQIPRSTYRYESTDRQDGPLREAIKEQACIRPRWGMPRLVYALRRDGWSDNHKRIHRIYTEENLQVSKRKRKRTARARRQPAQVPEQQNQRWSMDYMEDQLYEGNKVRIFNIVDDYTRECLWIEASPSIRGKRVVEILETLQITRDLPQSIVLDNGPEFTGAALDRWSYVRNAKLDFIDPGKPVQNCFIESFNGRLRDECLNQHWFISIEDMQEKVEKWRQDYNQVRPHSSLGNMPPEEYARLKSCLQSAPPPSGKTLDKEKVLTKQAVGLT